MKTKQFAKIALLFILLLIAAFSPIYFSGIQIQQLINKPVFAETDAEITISYESNTPVDHFERLWTIIMANSSEDGSITEQTDISMDEESVNSIITSLEAELRLLGEKNIVPPLSFSSPRDMKTLKKLTFMSRNNLSEAVTVWDIGVQYDGYSIQCWLDSETATIYQLEILFSKSGDHINVDSILPAEFIHYLNIPDDSIIDFLEASSTKGYYTFKTKDQVFYLDYRLSVDKFYYHLFFS